MLREPEVSQAECQAGRTNLGLQTMNPSLEQRARETRHEMNKRPLLPHQEEAIILAALQSAVEETARERDEARTELEDQAQYASSSYLSLAADLTAARAEIAALNEQLRYVTEQLSCVDCGAAPVEELARRAAKQITALTKRAEEAEVQLVALGDLAVADWDDKTVGTVDATVKEPTKYKDRLRALFVDIPNERDRLRDQLGEVRRDNQRLHSLLAQFSSNA
jgi:hypothetical protein